MAEAFPLHWPPGRARTKRRQRARFDVSFVRAEAAEARVKRLEEANERLRASLQRAYDSVLKDAPEWFEDGSHEQKALEVERDLARAALEEGERP